jgi:hypothetical protein
MNPTHNLPMRAIGKGGMMVHSVSDATFTWLRPNRW